MTKNLDQALETYSATSKSLAKKRNIAKMLGFGAAAAGSLLACHDAEAGIVYSGPVNGVLSAPDGGIAVDMEGDGINEVAFIFVAGGDATAGFNGNFGFAANGQNGTNAGILNTGTSGGFNFVAKLPASSCIDPADNFLTGTQWMGYFYGGTTSTDAWGAFGARSVTQTGFVGVQFNGVSSGGGTAQLYGWIQVQLNISSTDADGDGVTDAGLAIVDWAYEDTGQKILAGQTEAVPEPGSMMGLGLLALGAVGVRRRRKSA